MKSYIFLDIDGVLHTMHHQHQLYYEHRTATDEFGALFDSETVLQLARIVEVTGADIIIESSYKNLGLKYLLEMWNARKMPGRLIDITPNALSDKWLDDATFHAAAETTGPRKGLEIASWLIDHATAADHYVIIDDEPVALPSQQRHFVLADAYFGLTASVADAAIDILRSSI